MHHLSCAVAIYNYTNIQIHKLHIIMLYSTVNIQEYNNTLLLVTSLEHSSAQSFLK